MADDHRSIPDAFLRRTRRPRLARTASIVVLAALATAGMFSGGCPSTASGISGSFVGQVAGTDLFVSVVTDGNQLLAYLCDGNETARWYEGAAGGPTTSLTSSAGDSEFSVTLDQGGGSGEVVLTDGSRATFALVEAEGQAGLYIAAETIGDADYLGSWIVLADGSQRGVVMSRTGILARPLLSLESLSANVPEVGTLQAAMFVPLSSSFGGGGFNFGSGSGFNQFGGGFNQFGSGFGQFGGGFNFGGAGFQFGGFQFGGFQFGGGGFNFGGGGGFNFGSGGFNFGQ